MITGYGNIITKLSGSGTLNHKIKESTDPLVENVLLGHPYKFQGDSRVGTLDVSGSGTNYADFHRILSREVSFRTYDEVWQWNNSIMDRTPKNANPEFIQELDPTTGYGIDFLKYNNVFGHKARFTNFDGDYFLAGKGFKDHYTQNQDFVDKNGTPYDLDHVGARVQINEGVGYIKNYALWVDHLYGVISGTMYGGSNVGWNQDATDMISSDLFGDGVPMYPAPILLGIGAIPSYSTNLGESVNWASGGGGWHNSWHVGRSGTFATPTYNFCYDRKGLPTWAGSETNVAILVWRYLNESLLNL